MSKSETTNNEDWSVEVPHLISLAEIVNKHLARVLADDVRLPSPTHNDELELFGGLLGLARIVEYNVRVAYELRFSKSPRQMKYAEVLREVEAGLVPHADVQEAFELLRRAAWASGGLGHGDFPTVEAALETLVTDFPSRSFQGYPPQHIIATTMTRHGFTLDVRTATATDKLGNPIPTTRHEPHKSKSYEQNFAAFYQTGAFVNLAELLREAFGTALELRETLRRR